MERRDGPPWQLRSSAMELPCLPSMFNEDTETLPNKRPPGLSLTFIQGPSASTPLRHSILSTAIVRPHLRRQLKSWSLRQLFPSTRILLAFQYTCFTYAPTLSLPPSSCHNTSAWRNMAVLSSNTMPESTRTSYTRLSKRAQNLCRPYESWARPIWSTS
jgi:hypothetical protein